MVVRMSAVTLRRLSLRKSMASCGQRVNGGRPPSTVPHSVFALSTECEVARSINPKEPYRGFAINAPILSPILTPNRGFEALFTITRITGWQKGCWARANGVVGAFANQNGLCLIVSRIGAPKQKAFVARGAQNSSFPRLRVR